MDALQIIIDELRGIREELVAATEALDNSNAVYWSQQYDCDKSVDNDTLIQ